VTAGTSFDAIAIFRQNQLDPATGLPLDPSGGVQLVSGGVRAVLTPELQNDAVADADQQIISRVRGGRLAGLLESRDQTLPDLDDQLQELAAALRFALNAAHNDASPVPPPAQLTGSRTDLADFAAATGAAPLRSPSSTTPTAAPSWPSRSTSPPRPTRLRSRLRSTPASAPSAAPRSAQAATSRSRSRAAARASRSPRATAGSRSPMPPVALATTASPTTSA
jgi:hypothetical protein